MQVKPDFDIDKWCFYNKENFKLELKENAPNEVKEKFDRWKERYLDRYK